jgi:hypothetical protein
VDGDVAWDGLGRNTTLALRGLRSPTLSLSRHPACTDDDGMIIIMVLGTRSLILHTPICSMTFRILVRRAVLPSHHVS